MALNGANRSNHLTRIIPNIARLIPDESGGMAVVAHGNGGYGGNVVGADSASSAAFGGGSATMNYEDSDLNTITRSQMNEDLIAYRYDLEFCQTQLTSQPGLSPQEIRTLQIRILDCGHNIRHCKHRIRILEAQARQGLTSYSTGPFGTSGAGGYRSGGSAVPTSRHKRQRVRKNENGEFDGAENGNRNAMVRAMGGEVDADADADGVDDSLLAAGSDMDASLLVPPTHTFQRLGYWDCRLCRSRKYLEAGSNRVPSAPCKWPLKDISKMINHFLDLHTEHTPGERCNELGDALARNRGPFEYWLTRTKAQELENLSVVDDYIRILQEGSLPDAMRGLLRAATMFPNTISNSYKK